MCASPRHTNSLLDSNLDTLLLQCLGTSRGGLHSGELLWLIYSEAITFDCITMDALRSHNFNEVELQTIFPFLSNREVVERKDAPVAGDLIF